MPTLVVANVYAVTAANRCIFLGAAQQLDSNNSELSGTMLGSSG